MPKYGSANAEFRVNADGMDVRTLAGKVVERVLSVYREDYIARCVREEPDSLLALVKALEAALARDRSRPAAIGVTTFGRQGVTQRTVAIGGTADELNTRTRRGH